MHQSGFGLNCRSLNWPELCSPVHSLYEARSKAQLKWLHVYQPCHEHCTLLLHLSLKGKRFCFIPLSSQNDLTFSAKECLYPLSSISLSLRFQTPWRPEGILSDRHYSSVLSFWCLMNAELQQVLRFSRWDDEADRLNFFFLFFFFLLADKYKALMLFCREIS